ncbi:MAG: hypothetical protein GKR89_26785 [Candidatus Latescibacteria bacterium]|nr:hypothetical protein [Candidatus Latescibacterota bacterium]
MSNTVFRVRQWTWTLAVWGLGWLALEQVAARAQDLVGAEEANAVAERVVGPGLKAPYDYAAANALARLPKARLLLVDAGAVPPLVGYKLVRQAYQWPRFNQLAAPLRQSLRGAVGGAYVGLMAMATDNFRHGRLPDMEPVRLPQRGDEALAAVVVGAGVGAVAYPLYKWIRPD